VLAQGNFLGRAKALSLIFASHRMAETPCAIVEQMRLVNSLCALLRWLPRDLVLS
jgi:uncharacterized protein